MRPIEFPPPARAHGPARRRALWLAVVAAALALPAQAQTTTPPASPATPSTTAPAPAVPGRAVAPPGAGVAAAPGAVAPSAADLLNEARETFNRRKDAVARARLTEIRDALVAQRHPLAMWADYWATGARLDALTVAEADAFLARWPGTYVEDRFRNDWLLELGKRRDWPTFAREHPRFRMADDREVACHALLVQHQAGQNVREAALAAWFAQRDLDDGCHELASALFAAERLSAADLWRRMQLAVEYNRPRHAVALAALFGPTTQEAVAAAMDAPAKLLARKRIEPAVAQRELATLALMRLASSELDAARTALAEGGWARRLDHAHAARVWAHVGKQAAFKLEDSAHAHYLEAWRRQRASGRPEQWSDETLAWAARAALRAPTFDRARAQALLQATESMSERERRDEAWSYWRARALLVAARSDAEREAARGALGALAGGVGWYAQLAAEALGQAPTWPAAPAPVTDAERARAAALDGLTRGLDLATIGLRDEGRREWNFTLRGMGERELLAAAQRACDAGDWQICINTSERTREGIALAQRYPLPHRAEITTRAQERGLEPALVFGLIRQETRFVVNLKSSVGASGLMQLMPATARWTARRLAMDFTPEQVWDVHTNLRLGTAYLKLLVDDFAGSLPMAVAAYNAGPNRPRRWRDGPVLDPAVWVENIPFNETRDYVKKVLGNATIYQRLLLGEALPLRARLGAPIGPRDAAAPAPDAQLP